MPLHTGLKDRGVKPSSSLHRRRAVIPSSGKARKVIDSIAEPEESNEDEDGEKVEDKDEGRDEGVSDEDIEKEVELSQDGDDSEKLGENLEAEMTLQIVQPDTPEAEFDSFSPPPPDSVWRAWKSKAKDIAQERKFIPRVAWSWPCPYPYCDDTFSDRDDLFNHYCGEHPLYISQPGAKSSLRCPFCGKGYKQSQKHTMRGHQRKEHRSNRWAEVGGSARPVGRGAESKHQEALFREAAVKGADRRT